MAFCRRGSWTQLPAEFVQAIEQCSLRQDKTNGLQSVCLEFAGRNMNLKHLDEGSAQEMRLCRRLTTYTYVVVHHFKTESSFAKSMHLYSDPLGSLAANERIAACHFHDNPTLKVPASATVQGLMLRFSTSHTPIMPALDHPRAQKHHSQPLRIKNWVVVACLLIDCGIQAGL